VADIAKSSNMIVLNDTLMTSPLFFWAGLGLLSITLGVWDAIGRKVSA
jgi:hypothetical protein